MSKLESPSLASSSHSTTPSTVPKDLVTDVLPNFTPIDAPSPAGSVAVPTPATPVNGTHEDNAGESSKLNGIIGKQVSRPKIVPNVEKVVFESRKRSKLKGRSLQDEEAAAQSAARIASSLAADQNAALNPDVDTPFTDAADVVKRLLPYHVFQHPAEDLASMSHGIGKGKRKATEEDLLREEIAETKFALQCWKRRRTLEKRFTEARTSAAKRSAPDDQAYVLAQAILESDRHENAAINAELRAAKQELDRLEREKKAAAAAAAAAAHPPQPRATYYPPQTTAPTSSAYPTQYRGYTYAYGQGYNSQYTYSPYATNPVPPNAWSTSVFSQTPRTSYTTPSSTTTNPPTSVSTATTVPSSTYASVSSITPQAPAMAPLTSTSPIPVQLPVTSLTALSALGIIPVPVANAPPPGQPQPAAVLKGTTQNGTMVSLEINVSSLQQNQMSGLAFILSALTSRGLNVDAAVAAATAPAASSNVRSAASPNTTGGTPLVTSTQNADGNTPSNGEPSTSHEGSGV